MKGSGLRKRYERQGVRGMMKTKCAFYVLTIVAVFAAVHFPPGVARAEDVVFLGKFTGGDYYYARDSIHRLKDGKVRVWVNLVFSKEAIESMGGTFPEIKDKMYRDVILYEIDCWERRYRIMQYAIYDKSGNVLKRATSEKPAAYDCGPGTVYDSLGRAVCR